MKEIIYIHRVDYKEVNFTFKTALDILCGIRDCYEMAQKYNLYIMYESELKNILYENLKAFYQYAVKDQKAIWNLIDQIYAIQYDWMGEGAEAFKDIKHLETYIAQQKEAKEKMLSACSAAQQIVIYGAGKAGRCFLKNWGKKCSNIIGFAVSEMTDNVDYIEGYEVRKITEYSRNALIIVAVSGQYAGAVMRNLDRLQIKNVHYVEYTDYDLLEEE